MSESLPVERLVILAAPARLIDIDVVNTFAGMLSLSPRVVQEIRSSVLRLVGKPVDYFSADVAAQAIKQPGLVVHDCRDASCRFPTARRLLRIGNTRGCSSPMGLGAEEFVTMQW